MTSRASPATLRDLPRIDVVLEHAGAKGLISAYSRAEVTAEVRTVVDQMRAALRGGSDVEVSTEAVLNATRERLERLHRPNQCRVINATGVILHTSLGRAPIAPSVMAAAAKHSAQYSLLELDRETGKRSDRDRLVNGLITRVTGAEAATVVNNNAAATMLILNTLADGREVVCSRAHMVEIGGSYRMPDVMRKAGCRLAEIGCTNKTRASDYEAAITANTAMLLKVHTSNYAIVGFTESATLEELVEIGKRRKVPVVYDLGAGSLVDLKPYGVTREPTVQELVAAGADLVCFSGDKLLGGPQAGIIVGRKELVQAVKDNALFRMMRCDKVTLSLLEHTLKLYLDPQRAIEEVPALAMISRSAAECARAARAIAARLKKRGIACDTRESRSQIGGGSTPGDDLPTTVVVIKSLGGTPDAATKRLRMGTPSVFCRIEEDHLVFDPRTVLQGQIIELVSAITAARK